MGGLMRTFVALFLIGIAAAAQTNAGSNHPGREPYTPTKQEWLLLSLVGDKTTWDYANTGEVQFTFSADDDPETIDVLVAYAKSATKEDVDNASSFAESRIRELATRHGWNWVRIRKSEMKMPEIKAPH
jgi:hypothetical protein